MPETAPRTHEPLRVAHGGAGGGGLANGRRSTAYARRRCQAAESAQSGQLWRSCWLADCAAAPRQVFVLVGSCWPAQSTSPRRADSCPRCTLPAASDLRCCCPLPAVRCLLPAGQRATGDAACRMCAGAGVRQVALRGRCRAAPVSNGVGRAARTSATGRQLPPSRGGPEPRGGRRTPGADRPAARPAAEISAAVRGGAGRPAGRRSGPHAGGGGPRGRGLSRSTHVSVQGLVPSVSAIDISACDLPP